MKVKVNNGGTIVSRRSSINLAAAIFVRLPASEDQEDHEAFGRICVAKSRFDLSDSATNPPVIECKKLNITWDLCYTSSGLGLLLCAKDVYLYHRSGSFC